MDLKAKQNTEPFLKKLKAQRHYYNVVKKYRKLRFRIAVLSLAVIPIVSLIWPITSIPLNALAIIILSINELLFGRLQNKYTRIAARIQEFFDTELFELPWNTGIAPVMDFSKSDAISRGAQALKNTDGLKDWYTFTPQTEMHHKILLAQLSNVSWDVAIRKAFNRRLVGLFILILIMPFALGPILKLSLIDFLLQLLLPFLPLIFLVGQDFWKNTLFIKKQENTIEHISSLLDSGQPVNPTMLRNIQDTIFKNRLEGIPVPNSIYNKRRDEDEKQMQESVAYIKQKLKVNKA